MYDATSVQPEWQLKIEISQQVEMLALNKCALIKIFVKVTEMPI